MSSKIFAFVAGALFCLSVNAAAIFDFGWTTASGKKVSGTLSGELSGNFVTNLQDVAISYGGEKIFGEIFQGHIDLQGWNWVSGGAYMSFDQSLNNFQFSDSQYGDPPPTFFFFDYTAFYTQQYPGMGYTWTYALTPNSGYGGETANWYLTAEATIPEPSSIYIFVLACFCMAAAVSKRRHACVGINA